MAALTKIPPPPAELAEATAGDATQIQLDIAAELPAILSITIESAEDYAFAAELASNLAGRQAKFRGMLQSATKPIKAAVKIVEKWFAPGDNDFQTALDYLRLILSKYQTAQRALEIAQREAAAKACAAQDTAAVVKTITAAASARDSITGTPVGGSASWEFEVVDAEAVPREFMCVDWSKLKITAKAAAKSETPPVVPGVKFFRSSNVRITKAKL